MRSTYKVGEGVPVEFTRIPGPRHQAHPNCTGCAYTLTTASEGGEAVDWYVHASADPRNRWVIAIGVRGGRMEKELFAAYVDHLRLPPQPDEEAHTSYLRRIAYLLFIERPPFIAISCEEELWVL